MIPSTQFHMRIVMPNRLIHTYTHVQYLTGQHKFIIRVMLLIEKPLGRIIARLICEHKGNWRAISSSASNRAWWRVSRVVVLIKVKEGARRISRRWLDFYTLSISSSSFRWPGRKERRRFIKENDDFANYSALVG